MVKREDEQAFAEMNAANPIFVEDAVRLFCEALKADDRIGDFRVIASHQESLHSHDAISINRLQVRCFIYNTSNRSNYKTYGHF